MRPTPTALAAMVDEAIVDAYDEYEQLAALHAVIEDRLALPFDTAVLGVTVTVTAVQRSGSGIVALCGRGRHRQAIASSTYRCPNPRLRGGPGWRPTGTGHPEPRTPCLTVSPLLPGADQILRSPMGRKRQSADDTAAGHRDQRGVPPGTGHR